MSEANSAPFGFDPADIDILLLTHAHLDHCGRIPLLVKRGFRGKSSPHLRRRGHAPVEPIYDEFDVLGALDFFGRNATYDQAIQLNEQLTTRFINAGHILGSASIVIDATEDGQSRRIVFTGHPKTTFLVHGDQDKGMAKMREN